MTALAFACQRTMIRQFARNDCLIHIDHRLKSNFRDDAISDSKLTAIMCGISRLECELCQRSLHVSLTIREREEIIQAARHSLIGAPEGRLASGSAVIANYRAITSTEAVDKDWQMVQGPRLMDVCDFSVVDVLPLPGSTQMPFRRPH